jgi:hypothetical protein
MNAGEDDIIGCFRNPWLITTAGAKTHRRTAPKEKRRPVFLLGLVLTAATFCSWFSPSAPAKSPPSGVAPSPLYVSLIDQISPQTIGPAFNGLDERRRGPIFAAALQQSVRAGKLPPLLIINKDLSIPETVAGEPKVPAGQTLVRITLTQWAQTRQGGIADTEILCRFFVEILQDGRVKRKLGPFFASSPFDLVSVALPEDRWAQYQADALKAINDMAASLRTKSGPVLRRSVPPQSRNQT